MISFPPSPISLGNKPFLYLQLMILMYPWAMNLGLVVISEFYLYLGSVYVRHREALETHWWDPGQDTLIFFLLTEDTLIV